MKVLNVILFSLIIGFINEGYSQSDSVSYNFVDPTKSTKRFDFKLWIYYDKESEILKIPRLKDSDPQIVNFKSNRKGLYFRSNKKWHNLKTLKTNRLCLNGVCLDSINKSCFGSKLIMSCVFITPENIQSEDIYYFCQQIGLVAISSDYGLFFREDLFQDIKLIAYINRLESTAKDREFGRFKNSQ